MIILNQGQALITHEALEWLRHPTYQVFQFGGLAGRGKSVVLSEIVRLSGLSMDRILPMAYTGQAACVMRQNGLTQARTIHSSLWSPSLRPGEHFDEFFNRPEEELFFIKKDLSGIDLIIIDEGRMVPLSMKKDIEGYGIPILVCGDGNQLPPIYDEPAYLRDDDMYWILTEPMRQKEGDGILYIADLIREGKPIPTGTYGNAMVIEHDELTDDMIADSNIVICGKNKTKDNINKMVRENILGIDNARLPQYGERMMCKKNNSRLEVDGINLCNGLIGTVQTGASIETFDTKTYQIDFLPDMLYNSFRDLVCDYQFLIAPTELRDQAKMNRYNQGAKMIFAYACTTHSTQGASIPRGIYIEENLGSSIQKNLNYTGVTRFKNKLIYVKRKKKYFFE